LNRKEKLKHAGARFLLRQTRWFIPGGFSVASLSLRPFNAEG
jgi:hypothetical protein